MKKIFLVSFNGVGKTGGVERVCLYLKQILSLEYNVQVITLPYIRTPKFRILFGPFVLLIKLFFLSNKFVISNSWQLFPYKSDISIHHGTTAGIMNYLENKSIGLKCIALMEKLSARNAKNVLAVSENCAYELTRFYKISQKKITILQNFVDDSIFYPIINEKRDNHINVLFVGALCERKGLFELKTFSDFIERQNNIKLYIACNNSENTELFKNNKNTEISIGLELEQMVDFYRNGDILYFPTKYEGFSMSTLEALSSGCPVIGSNFAITKELEKYEFCKLINNFEPEFVYNEIKQLYKIYKNKRNEIHDEIIREYGKEKYKKRILSYVKEKIGD